MDLIAMGSKLAELRRLHKVSASALAEAVGISRGYLSRVENGRQVPSLVILTPSPRSSGSSSTIFLARVRWDKSRCTGR